MFGSLEWRWNNMEWSFLNLPMEWPFPCNGKWWIHLQLIFYNFLVNRTWEWTFRWSEHFHLYSSEQNTTKITNNENLHQLMDNKISKDTFNQKAMQEHQWLLKSWIKKIQILIDIISPMRIKKLSFLFLFFFLWFRINKSQIYYY